MLSPDRSPRGLQERITLVETSLGPTVRRDGQEIASMPIDERMAFYHVPGLSLAVIDDHRVAWAKGYGVMYANDGRPVGSETLFQAASISKPVAALAALRLVEGGALALDADVNQQLRSWQLPENEFTREEKVTLRRLDSRP